MNEEIKLFLAKGCWVNYVHHYYFQDTLGKNFEHLNNLEIKDRLEFFTDHINQGLSLNKKDWINYLINEGWSKDEEDVNDTWFDTEERFYYEVKIENECEFIDFDKMDNSQKIAFLMERNGYIEDGIGLDDTGNEFRDDNGQALFIDQQENEE